MLVTSGTVTSAARCRAAAATGRHPPVRAGRHVQFATCFLDHWPPILRCSRKPTVAEPDHGASPGRSVPLILVNGRVSERSYRRWRMRRAAIFAGAAARVRSLPRAVGRRCRALRRPRRAALCHHRQSQARRRRRRRRRRQAARAAGHDRHAAGDRRNLHPSRRGGRGDVDAHLAANALLSPVSDPCAAPSRARPIAILLQRNRAAPCSR